MTCNHQNIDGYGWLVIIVGVIYIAAVYRLDLWLLERMNWHSDTELDYSSDLFNSNVQANVAKAAKKEMKEAGDDKDKNP